MKKTTRRWLVIAAALILAGGLLFVGVMFMNNWNFSKISTRKTVTNTYEIAENYRNISIDTDTARIVFLPADDEQTQVVCHEYEKATHLVSVKDGALSIELVDTMKWYENIGIGFDSPRITIYLPAGTYGDLTIRNNTGDMVIPKAIQFENVCIRGNTGDVFAEAIAAQKLDIQMTTGDICIVNGDLQEMFLQTSTGKITVSDLTCSGDVQLRVTTGKTDLSRVQCRNITSAGNTGDISLCEVVASQKFTIERSTGDVSFDRCDAGELFVRTDTGDVTGNLLTDKVFLAKSNTGKVDVPKTITGGRCEIETDTGKIVIKVG